MTNQDIYGSGGGKGGGSEGKPPKEDPNTLRSRAIARFIDLIGEGEIEGLVNGYNSVFFDRIPIEDDDGNIQVQGINSYHLMPGAPDHTPLTEIPGFSDFPTSESETIVNLPLTLKDGSVTRTVTNTAVDSLSLTFIINALYRIDMETGDTKQTTVSWSVSIQGTGAPNPTIVKTFEKKGKCVAPYQLEYGIHNLSQYPGTYPYSIICTRITSDTSSNTLQNATVWYSYTQITNRVMVYPDSAIFAAEVDSSKFGSRIPSRAYEVHGLITQIPSNYYPYSYKPGSVGGGKGGGIYEGTWDGSFKPGWHSNPAWVYYDILTNKRYGLGLDEEYVDIWSLYSIGRYCDQLVPDGYGGTEPRFTFNGVLMNREDAINVLGTIASAFRAMPYWGGGLSSASQDSPKEPSKNVTAANVIDGQFTYTGTSIKDRHTVVNVSWNDPNEFYKLEIEPVDDGDAIARFGYRPLDLAAIGCTSRGQAYRHGRWALESEQNQTEAVSYKASLDHADVLPGDIIKVFDPNYLVKVRYGGRTASATGNTITLDAPVTLDIGETYSISVTLPDGETEEKDINTIPDGQEHTTLIISGSFTEVPLTNSVWILSSTAIEPRLFMVSNIKEIERNMFEISAVYYDPNKYARVEDGKEFDPIPMSKVPSARNPISPPTALNAEEYSYDYGESRAFGILFSWTHTRDPRFFQYDVQYRLSTESYGTNETMVITDTFADIKPVTSGIYYLRIRATGLGVQSPWVELSEFSVYADPAAPPDITGLEVINGPDATTFNGPDCEIGWDELLLTVDVIDSTASEINISTLTKLKDYQIEVLKTDDTHLRYEFTTDETFIYTLGMNLLDNGTPIRNLKFKLSARDIYGKLSNDATVLLASNPEPSMAGLIPTVTAIFNGIKVDWSSIIPTDNDMSKFVIYMDTVNPPTTNVAELSKNTTYWVEPGLQTNFTYFVQVQPWDEFGAGIKSAVNGVVPIGIQSEDIGFELVSRLTLTDSLGNGNEELAHLYDGNYFDDGEVEYNSGDWIQYQFPIEQIQDRVHFWCDNASINCYIAVSADEGSTWTYLKGEADHTLDTDGRLLTASSQADAITNYWTAAAGAGQINTALYPNGLTGTAVRLYILSNSVGMYELRFVDQVIAEQITANNLAAISANLGVISAGILQSSDLDADEGVLIDLDNEVIKFGGTSNPSLSWDGAKVEMNIADDGSINIGDQGSISIGEDGQLTMDDGGYLRVGNNIEITTDDNESEITVAQDTNVDPTTGRLNLTGVDYLTINQASVVSYYWDGVAHRPYKSLTRIETGEAKNNEFVNIDGIFKTRPKVFITPKVMPSYDHRYPNQSQSFRFDVTELQNSTSPFRWKFKARASLELADSFAGIPVNSTVSGSTTITGPTVTLPLLSTRLSVGVQVSGRYAKSFPYFITRATKDTDAVIEQRSKIYVIISTINLYYYVTGVGWQHISLTMSNDNKSDPYAVTPYTLTTKTYSTSQTITQFYCNMVYSSYKQISNPIVKRYREDGVTQSLTTVGYTTDLGAAQILIPGTLNWMAIE